MFNINVALNERSYPIMIGHHQLSEMMLILDAVLPHECWIIVSEQNVWRHYGASILKHLEPLARIIDYHLLPSGEQVKNLSTFSKFLEEMCQRSINRKTALIAFGGGSIGDVTGFAASILLRGLDYVQIPTTLLAQIDSAIGGKTSINSSQGKNLIGTIYQPKAVMIDLSFLETLSTSQRLSGYAEMLKYAIALDVDFFEFLETSASYIIALHSDYVAKAVQKSCTIKANIVSMDEMETGYVRQLLNFGHTIGHALELYSHTRKKPLLHGEAIAIGMMVDCRLAVKQGIFSQNDLNRIERHYQTLGLSMSYPRINIKKLLSYMQKDKKNTGNKIKTFFPQKIGQLQEMEYSYDEFLTLLSEDKIFSIE